jgi:hypothetical protein
MDAHGAGWGVGGAGEEDYDFHLEGPPQPRLSEEVMGWLTARGSGAPH